MTSGGQTLAGAPSGAAGSASLDMVRALAILFVVASHLPLSPLSLGLFAYSNQALGILGVGLFFVHTCLVLMRSLQRQTLRTGAAGRARIFFIRRAFRIYPLSLAAVLGMAGIGWALARPVPASQLWSNLLLVQNVTGDASLPEPLWSLPYEVQMYLLLPLIFGWTETLPTRRASWCVALLWAGAVAAVLALWGLGLNYHLIKYWPCFLPGILAFTLQRQPGRLAPFWLFGYLALAAVAFPAIVAQGVPENAALWGVCLGLGLAIALCREVQGGVLAKGAAVIARYSYGIYLVHLPVLVYVFDPARGWPAAVQWAVFLGATGGISVVAHYVIEQPGIRAGDVLARSPP